MTGKMFRTIEFYACHRSLLQERHRTEDARYLVVPRNAASPDNRRLAVSVAMI